MNIILASLLSTGLFLRTAAPSFAGKPVDWLSKHVNHPALIQVIKNWQKLVATPGNPVTLEGKGTLRANGRGQVRYDNTTGTVNIGGRGVVGVKGNSNVEVMRGFGDKKQIGDWTYYYGKGALKINGGDFDAVGFGRIKTGAEGEGKATFRGNWKVRYQGENSVSTHLDALTVPIELKIQAGADAELK